MPTEPRPISLFDVARRAIEISDPDDRDSRLGDLLEQFEDADEPVTAIQNLEERVAIAVEGVDVEIDDPAGSRASPSRSTTRRCRWPPPRFFTSPTAATSCTTTRPRSSASRRGRNGRAIRPGRSWTGWPTAASSSERWGTDGARAEPHRPGTARRRGGPA